VAAPEAVIVVLCPEHTLVFPLMDITGELLTVKHFTAELVPEQP
jgi:hypothetical protein